MLKKLPKILKIVLSVFIFVSFFTTSTTSYAQSVSPAPDPSTGWIKDQEVTFVGKTATRANDFLEWTLSFENYRWITIPVGTTTNPIQDFWVLVRNIVFV